MGSSYGKKKKKSRWWKDNHTDKETWSEAETGREGKQTFVHTEWDSYNFNKLLQLPTKQNPYHFTNCSSGHSEKIHRDRCSQGRQRHTT